MELDEELDFDIPECGDVFDDGSDFVYLHDPRIYEQPKEQSDE